MLRFYRFSLFVLVFVVGVIVWGALVRATGSGAGCGAHWPLCHGEILPVLSRFQTVIEFSHRVTSGLSLLLVFGLGIWAYRLAPRGHLLRRMAFWSMVAITFEALIGAALVLLRLVEHDRSLDRAVSIVFHLGNTCFLVGSLTLLSWVSFQMVGPWAHLKEPPISLFPVEKKERRSGFAVLGGFVFLAASGALTALGDTLFEVSSFQQGWVRDWARDAHFLERLRVFHPVLALTWMVFAMIWLQKRASPWRKRALHFLLLNMGVGVLNVAFAAPIFLQLVHLLVANLLWISFVMAFIEPQKS